MTKRTFDIGDVVAWDDVPDGAMVRYGDRYYVRLPDNRGWWVGAAGRPWTPSGPPSAHAGVFVRFGWPLAFSGEEVADERLERGWTWSWHNDNEPATIVALNLTGQETADDLRRLAEVFEVREALTDLDWPDWRFLPWDVERALEEDDASAVDRLAESLHAAGWRPGDSAERAAQLLARGDADAAP